MNKSFYIKEQKNNAKVLYHKRQYDKAGKIYEEILRTSKIREKFALIGLAKVRIQQEKFEEAEALLRETIELYSESFKPIFQLGRLYVKQNKYDEAEKYLKRSLELADDDYDPLVELAILYKYQENYDEAERILKSLLKEIENYSDLKLYQKRRRFIIKNLCMIYKKTNDINKYIELFNFNQKRLSKYDEETDTRIKHIQKHFKFSNRKKFHGIFNYDLEELLEYAMKNKKNKISKQFWDIYQIPYKNCGYAAGKSGDGHSLDYLILVLISGTDNVLAFYPSDKKFDEETL